MGQQVQSITNNDKENGNYDETHAEMHSVESVNYRVGTMGVKKGFIARR